MKKHVYILFLVMLLLAAGAGKNCQAQSPTWAWAKKATTFGGSLTVSGMGSDAAGNTYTAGVSFTGMQFGNLPSLPDGMFLVKHSPHGNPVWAKQANCRPNAIATDSVGNIYVTGTFRDTLVLGSTMLICKGKQDIFVAKFDSAGSVVWANRAGGIGDHPNMPPTPIIVEDEAYSLGIDEMGNCYLGGLVKASDTSAAMFDTIAVFPPNSTLFPIRINIIAKYNSSGHVQWVKTFNNTAIGTKAIAVNRQGTCFGVGGLWGTANLGSISLTSQGQGDIALFSLDPGGNLNWAKRIGGSGNDRGDDIAVDSQGNLIITGSFADTVNFDSFTLIKPVPSSSSSGTVFIAKLTSSGNVLWASQVFGSGFAGDSELALDAVGNSYISSVFGGTVQIGQQTFSSPNGFYDVLVSKWNPVGAPVWAVAAQGSSNDYPQSIVVDPVTSACYVAGSFEADLNFGSITLHGGQAGSFFLAKLDQVVTGIPALAKTGAWRVYPNPAAQAFYVTHLNPAAATTGEFLLYNTTGQLVSKTGFNNASEFKVERQGLPAGLYFYKLQKEGKMAEAGKIVLH